MIIKKWEKIKSLFLLEPIWFLIIFLLVSIDCILWLFGYQIFIDAISKFFPWDGWDTISAIALIITAFFIARYTSATRNLVNKTLPAKMNVGLITIGNETKLSIFNASEFPVWLWVDIGFFEDDKHKKSIGEPYRGNGFYICPNQPLEPMVEQADSLIQEYNKIYARVKYRFNITNSSKVPPINVHFGYTRENKPDSEENRWLITDGGIGTEFKPLYR